MFLKPFLLVLPFSFLSSCVSMVVMDEEFLAKNASESFEFPAKSCYESSKLVLEDIGGGIQVEKKDELKFSSNRFNIHTLVQSRGTGAHMTVATLKEDHKFYIGVTGDESQCTVKILKYRVWTNNKENKRINQIFTVPTVFKPFFRELKIQLENKF